MKQIKQRQNIRAALFSILIFGCFFSILHAKPGNNACRYPSGIEGRWRGVPHIWKTPDRNRLNDAGKNNLVITGKQPIDPEALSAPSASPHNAIRADGGGAGSVDLSEFEIHASDAPARSKQLLKLTDGEKSTYSIAISKTATAAEKWSAGELREYIRKMSGASLPIVEEGKIDVTKPVIWISPPSAMMKKIPELANKSFKSEEFLILAYKKDILIAGGDPRGVMYGVYELLENVWGCHWLTPDCEIIPPLKTLTLPADFKLSGKPALEYRDVLFKEAFDPIWAVRNRVPGAAYEFKTALMDKGGRRGIWPLCHGMDQIVPFKKFHSSHPDLFATKREGGIEYRANCYSNPELYLLAKNKIREWLKTHADAEVYDISQKDVSPDGCHCKQCQALIDAEGSQIAPILFMANRLARNLKTELGDKFLTVVAYSYSLPPPKTLRAEPNVVVRLCLDPHLATLREGAIETNILKQWITRTDHLWVWLYCNDYVDAWVPYPNVKTFAENIRFLASQGVKGIMAQGLVRGGGDMPRLKAWVWAKMMWNPSADINELIDTFLKGYYGKSANSIRKYVDLMDAAARRLDVKSIKQSYWNRRYQKFTDSKTISKAYDYLCEAEKLANNETIRKRVAVAALCVRFVKMINGISPRAILENGKYGFKVSPEAKKESQEWFKDVKKSGFNICSEFVPIEVLQNAFKKVGETYQTVTLNNNGVGVVVVPELGGRIVSLRHLPKGENLLNIGYISKKLPYDTGICETFARHAVKMLGDKVVYKVNKLTDSQVILSGQLSNGEIVEKDISIANDKPEVQVNIEIQNPTSKTFPMQRLHIWIRPNRDSKATRKIEYQNIKSETKTFTVGKNKRLLIDQHNPLVQSTAGWILKRREKQCLLIDPMSKALDMTIYSDEYNLKLIRIGTGGWVVPANGGKAKINYTLSLINKEK